MLDKILCTYSESWMCLAMQIVRGSCKVMTALFLVMLVLIFAGADRMVYLQSVVAGFLCNAIELFLFKCIQSYETLEPWNTDISFLQGSEWGDNWSSRKVIITKAAAANASRKEQGEIAPCISQEAGREAQIFCQRNTNATTQFIAHTWCNTFPAKVCCCSDLCQT